jgi:hypothetical protein
MKRKEPLAFNKILNKQRVELKPVDKKPLFISASKVKFMTSREATKEIRERVNKATLDSRYVLNSEGIPLTRFRPLKRVRGKSSAEVNAGKIGKVSLAGLTDDAVSVVNTATYDADRIAALYGVQPLRGVRVGASKGAAASMGDGVLRLNKDYVNRYSSGINADKSAAAIKALDDDIEQLTKQYEDSNKLIRGIQSKYHAGEISRAEWSEQADKHNKLITKLNGVIKKRNSLTAIEPTKANTWRFGDDPKQRPFTSGSYFSTPEEELRSTIYHEMGHHIHQQFRVVDSKTYYSPPLEDVLETLWRSNRNTSPTKYGDTNSKEWFAENFALYNMGRTDLVAPVLKSLLESMIQGDYDQFIDGVD